MNFYFMPKYSNNPIKNSKHPVGSRLSHNSNQRTLRLLSSDPLQADALRMKSAACWWSYYGVYFCSGQIQKPKRCNWKIYDDVKLKEERSGENLVKSGPNWQEIGVVGGAYAVHSSRMRFIVWFHVSDSSSFLFIYRELVGFRRFFHSIRFVSRLSQKGKNSYRYNQIFALWQKPSDLLTNSVDNRKKAKKSDNTISVIFSCRQFLSLLELTACSEAFFCRPCYDSV